MGEGLFWMFQKRDNAMLLNVMSVLQYTAIIPTTETMINNHLKLSDIDILLTRKDISLYIEKSDENIQSLMRNVFDCSLWHSGNPHVYHTYEKYNH